MPALNAATIASMYKAAGLQAPGAAGVQYYLGKGAKGADLLKANLSKDKRSGTFAAPATPAAPVDPTQRFIDSIKEFLPKQTTAITPFDQSGFYNEGDTNAAADQEYDPFYAREKQYADTSNADQDQQRLEQVNASGGLGSSAYEREMQLRKAALARASEQMGNQQVADKDQFKINRRNDAYQRYLQSTGAVTAS